MAISLVLFHDVDPTLCALHVLGSVLRTQVTGQSARISQTAAVQKEITRFLVDMFPMEKGLQCHTHC
jgi:hypothetical protein